MRLFSVFLLAVFAVGCSGDDEDELPDISTLFPANNEIGSWVEDTSKGTAGVEIATDENGIVDLINGGAEPFLARTYNGFGIEYYTDGTYELELRIWQFTSAAVSTEIYDALLTESTTHQSSTWENASLGTAGRVSNTNVSWWFNVREGAHLLEVTIAETGVSPDAASKSAGETFVNGVLAKL